MRALKTCLLAVGLLSFMLLVYTSPTDAAAAADKKTLDNYKQHCLKCHGEQGKGDGPVTKTVKNMKMSDQTSKDAMAKFKEDLFKLTSEGGAAVGKSKIMLAYKDKLKEKEIRDLVAYIRSLAAK